MYTLDVHEHSVLLSS